MIIFFYRRIGQVVPTVLKQPLRVAVHRMTSHINCKQSKFLNDCVSGFGNRDVHCSAVSYIDIRFPYIVALFKRGLCDTLQRRVYMTTQI